MPGDIGKAFAQHLSVVRSRSGTAETGVVVLITQRSQVQILPPLQGQRPREHRFRGRFLLLVTKLLVTPRARSLGASPRGSTGSVALAVV